MTNLVSIDGHKKTDDSSKHDLKDVHGNVLKFNLRPCGHCFGTIVYTREQEVEHPFGTATVETNVLSCCVKPVWWMPWEHFMAKKSLLLRRLARIKRDVEWANSKYHRMENLKSEIENA